MAIRKNGSAEVAELPLLLFWIILFLATSTNGYMIDGNPNRRAAFLDKEGKYRLEWMVNFDTNHITFNVTVKTHGWILFGLANNAEQQTGRDVVVGGVLGRNGKAYFGDRHEEGHSGGYAILDRSQDYQLEYASETRTETFLSFSRKLETCDPEDYPITENKVSLIWAYGDTDNYDAARGGGHRRNGSYEIYLLDPEYAPKTVRDPVGNPRLIGGLPNEDSHHLKLWTINTRTILPSDHTSYLCTIHKAPSLHRKHHIIGYEMHVPNATLDHAHHIGVFKCNAPRGSNAHDLFESFVGNPAESCYFPARPPRNPEGLPTYLCGELTFGWGLGGRAFFLPPEAGIPFGEDIDEYFLVQTHFDNPQNKRNVEVTVRIDAWYTPELRPNDAGYISVGVNSLSLPPTIIIPPRTSGHRILGHCSSQCTERMFPHEGISLFAGVIHSHNSGSRVRLRHFDMKKKMELPWVTYDDNYSNRFQQMRQFKEVTRILPGDQLTVECTYDNRWTNGSVIGGLSTRQEMCVAFIFYHSRIMEYTQCRSEIVSEEGRRRWLGETENISAIESVIDWMVTSPRRLSGKTLTEISDGLRWDDRERAELQRYHLETPAVGSCSRDLFARSRDSFREAVEFRKQIPVINPPIELDTKDDFSGLVEYPFAAKPYVPPAKNKCPSSKRY